MFNDRVVVGPQKSFSHTDLLEYVESLLKKSKLHEERTLERSNYSWLRSRSLDAPVCCDELDELKPVLTKMSSESCSVIAVKLDSLTDEVATTQTILAAFKNLLEEQYNAQAMDERISRAKGTKREKSKRNRVHPELSPPGRQPTVSFILNELQN